MNNNTFSLARLGSYAQSETRLHKKRLLNFLGLYIAGWLGFHLWMEIVESGASSVQRLYAGMALGLFITTLMAARTFSVFHRTSKGTFAMQAPVSNSEKFSLRSLIYVIILPVLALMIPTLICLVEQPVDVHTSDILEQIPVFVLISATFLWGSVIFSKSPYIKVLSGWIVLGLILVTLVSISGSYPQWRELIVGTLNWFEDYIIVITSLMTILFVWHAWSRFRKLQILK